MRTIQSSSNPRIRNVRKLLQQRKQSLFVIEGKRLVREAMEAGLRLDEVFATPEFWTKERTWLQPLEQQGTDIVQLAPSLLKSISSVDSPQGIVAVAHKPSLKQSTAIQRFALLLISMRDPGNFGAVLRTAEACGVEWIAYTSDSADPFQSKVVRASMGSLFRLPLLEVSSAPQFIMDQMAQKVSVYGLEKEAGQSLLNWKPSFPLIACVGSESHGLPEDLPLTDKISIPMKGKVESLNAAVAAAVFLYNLANFSRDSVTKEDPNRSAN